MGPSENGFNGYQRFERIESAVERLSTAVLTMAEQMHAMASHGHTINEMMGKLADAQLRLSLRRFSGALRGRGQVHPQFGNLDLDLGAAPGLAFDPHAVAIAEQDLQALVDIAHADPLIE